MNGTAAQGSARANRGRSKITKAILTVVGIALFFGFLALGTWQVQRRAWKLDLMERVEQRLHTAPTSLAQLDPAGSSESPDALRNHEYQPVFAEGRWLADKTVFTQALTTLGAGFWVITPLETTDGTQVLVNRGFVPEKQRAEVQALPSPDATVRVEGLLRMTEPAGGFLRKNDPANGKWYSRDVTEIGKALGLARTQPVFIDQGIPSNANVNADTPLPANAMQGPWPKAGMTVVKFHNSHSVYIATWFGLALMVLVAAYFVVRHERRAKEPTRT